MKKSHETKVSKRALHIQKETLRTLDTSALVEVAGAGRLRVPGGWMDENTVFYPDAV